MSLSQLETMNTTERPILMSAPMVRAILDGTKTQTRRAGKYQNPAYTELECEPIMHATKGEVLQATYRAYTTGGTARWAIEECRYGIPGNRLWVKETWGTNSRWDDIKPSELPGGDMRPSIYYRADRPNNVHPERLNRWRPSIFMPRWASRITLEILDIRVERLQDISEADADAEGCCVSLVGHDDDFARNCYRALWEKINGTGSFSLNPFVWVIEFNRIKPCTSNSHQNRPSPTCVRSLRGCRRSGTK